MYKIPKHFYKLILFMVYLNMNDFLKEESTTTSLTKYIFLPRQINEFSEKNFYTKLIVV